MLKKRVSRKRPARCQLVGFSLADQTYGVQTTGTREIILMGEISQVPQLTGRALVADDVRDIRLLFAAFLRIAGVRSSFAENGQVAYEKVIAARESGRPFDLLLMNLAMPEVDGVATPRRLRDAGYTGTIIMHTANAAIDGRKMCFEAGCDDYLEKPIRRDDFFALLSKYLPGQSSAPEQP